MRHMPAGGQGHQEGHTEKNQKSNAGIWRNLDFSFKPYSSGGADPSGQVRHSSKAPEAHK